MAGPPEAAGWGDAIRGPVTSKRIYERIRRKEDPEGSVPRGITGKIQRVPFPEEYA